MATTHDKQGSLALNVSSRAHRLRLFFIFGQPGIPIDKTGEVIAFIWQASD